MTPVVVAIVLATLVQWQWLRSITAIVVAIVVAIVMAIVAVLV